jgi:hypothetical protein
MPTVDLPENGELQLGAIRLPAGRRIVAGYGSGGPAAWATTVPLADPGRIWQALSDLSPDTGLVPFLLAGLDDTGGRPWDNNEFSDPADISAVDELDAAELLAELWSGEFEEDDPGSRRRVRGIRRRIPGDDRPVLTPAPRPGPAATQGLTEAETSRALGTLRPARIGLAAASRPPMSWR